MGYKLIKPLKGGIKSQERICVSKNRIYFTKALHNRLGLLTRPKCALLYEDTDTGNLCFDIKDAPFPNAFKVSVHTDLHSRTTCCIFCEKKIEMLGLEKGRRYTITGTDGSVYKTDIKVHRRK